MRATAPVGLRAVALFIVALTSCGDAYESPPPPPLIDADPGTTVAGMLASRLDAHLSAIATWGYSGEFLVADGSTVVLHRGYGYADRSARAPVVTGTRFDIGSIAKIFTVAAVLQLAADGRLTLDDSLARFIPAAPADKAGITVRQLLTHTGGLEMYHDEDVWQPWGLGKDAALERIFEIPLEYPPGQGYSYSNSGMTLLAAIVESASRQSFQSYVRRSLLDPAGLTSTGWEGDPIPDSAPAAVGYYRNRRGESVRDVQKVDWRILGAGGMHSTSSDLWLFREALFRGDLLPDSLVAAATAPADGSFNPARFDEQGMGWRIWRAGEGIAAEKGGHTGGEGFSALFRTHLDDGPTLIFTLNAEDEAYGGIHGRIGVKLHRMMRGEHHDLPPAATPDSGLTAARLGLVEHPGGGLIRITESGGRLLAAAGDQAGVEALLHSDSAESASLHAANARADTLLRLVHGSGRLDAVAALMSDSNEASGLVTGGKARFTGYTVWGSAPEWIHPTDGIVTFVRLLVDGDTVVRRLHWDTGGRLRSVGGAAFPAPLFAYVIQVSPDSAELYQLELGRRTALEGVSPEAR